MSDSAVARVSALKLGETYSQTKIFPAIDGIDAAAIKLARRQLMQTLSSIIARVKEKHDVELRVRTTCAFTADYDVVVTGLIVRVEDDDDI